jgi:hypothetical protein
MVTIATKAPAVMDNIVVTGFTEDSIKRAQLSSIYGAYGPVESAIEDASIPMSYFSGTIVTTPTPDPVTGTLFNKTSAPMPKGTSGSGDYDKDGALFGVNSHGPSNPGAAQDSNMARDLPCGDNASGVNCMTGLRNLTEYLTAHAVMFDNAPLAPANPATTNDAQTSTTGAPALAASATPASVPATNTSPFWDNVPFGFWLLFALLVVFVGLIALAQLTRKVTHTQDRIPQSVPNREQPAADRGPNNQPVSGNQFAPPAQPYQGRKLDGTDGPEIRHG